MKVSPNGEKKTVILNGERKSVILNEVKNPVKKMEGVSYAG